MMQDECSRFGVRALPKKKMIAKLTEIYDYTHPLTGTGRTLLISRAPPPSNRVLPFVSQMLMVI